MAFAIDSNYTSGVHLSQLQLHGYKCINKRIPLDTLTKAIGKYHPTHPFERYKLRNVPSLAELKSLGKLRKGEIGLELNTKARKCWAIFGEKDEVAGSKKGNMLIHNHLRTAPHYFLPSEEDQETSDNPIVVSTDYICRVKQEEDPGLPTNKEGYPITIQTPINFLSPRKTLYHKIKMDWTEGGPELQWKILKKVLHDKLTSCVISRVPSKYYRNNIRLVDTIFLFTWTDLESIYKIGNYNLFSIFDPHTDWKHFLELKGI